MRKGFTLIELLAVIVILAIIALIATPIILGIINDARKEANERSVELYASAVRNAIAAYQLTGTTAPKSFDDLTIQYDGNVVCETEELYEDGSFYIADCTVNGNVVNYTYGEKEYSYGTELGYTGTIYRNSTEVIGIGNYINTDNRWCAVVPGVADACIYNDYAYMAFNSKAECETMIEEVANSGELDETLQYLVENAVCEQGTLTYETDLSNISQNKYLKHDVVNNEVTASYACATYIENGTRKDVCLRGVDSSCYESNQTILTSLDNYFDTISYNDSVSGNGLCNNGDALSYCWSDSLNLNAAYYGTVNVHDYNAYCYVNSDGSSYCYEK